MKTVVQIIFPAILAIILFSCTSQRTVYNERDYTRSRVENRNGWALLGERRADSRGRMATIYPRNTRGGSFSQLQFVANGTNLDLYRATIVYANGSRETIRLANGHRNTKVFKLNNRRNNVRQIIVENSSNTRMRNNVSVTVYAR